MTPEHINTIRRVCARYADLRTVVHTEEEVFASFMSELEWWAVRGGFAYDEEFLNWKVTRALPFFQHMKRKEDPYAGLAGRADAPLAGSMAAAKPPKVKPRKTAPSPYRAPAGAKRSRK